MLKTQVYLWCSACSGHLSTYQVSSGRPMQLFAWYFVDFPDQQFSFQSVLQMHHLMLKVQGRNHLRWRAEECGNLSQDPVRSIPRAASLATIFQGQRETVKTQTILRRAPDVLIRFDPERFYGSQDCSR